jgi:hypothetical protein
LAPNLTGITAVDEWAFNYNGSSDDLDPALNEALSSGMNLAAVTFDPDARGSLGGFRFAFDFDLPNASHGDLIANRFTRGDQLTFDITRVDGGALSAEDFRVMTADGYYTAAHLFDTGPEYNQSAKVTVPEPTTIIAGALLLLPFGVSTLRILRKKRAA